MRKSVFLSLACMLILAASVPGIVARAAGVDPNVALLEALKAQLSALQQKAAIASKTSTQAALVCSMDAKMCSDGSFVSRDPALNCQFKVCPLSKDMIASSTNSSYGIAILAPSSGETLFRSASSDDLDKRYPIKFSVTGAKSFADLEYKIELYRDVKKLGHVGWPAVRPVHMDSKFWEFNWDVASYYDSKGDYSYAPAGQGYRFKITLLNKSKPVATYEREFDLAGSGADDGSPSSGPSTIANFTSPSQGVIYVAGKLEYFRWTIQGDKSISTVSTGTFSIVDSRTKEVKSVLPAVVKVSYGKNVYAWSVPKTLDSGSYFMRLSYFEQRVDGSAVTAVSVATPEFTILNSARPAVVVYSPKSTDSPVSGQSMIFGWYLLGATQNPLSTKVSLVTLDPTDDPILVSSTAVTNIFSKKNTTSYVWPNSYNSGGYRVKVECEFKDGKKAVGYSDIFKQSK